MSTFSIPNTHGPVHGGPRGAGSETRPGGTVNRSARSVVVLSGAALLLTTSPAAAHDVLLDADPQQGSTLSQAPEDLQLTFSAPLQDVGAQVIVTGPDGADVTDAQPEVSGDTVVQPLRDDASAPGEYAVAWRVVSSDGHPIEGEHAYTVGQGGATSTGPASQGSPEAQGDAEERNDAGADESVDARPEPIAAGVDPLWLILGGGLAVLGTVAAAVVLMRRMTR